LLSLIESFRAANATRRDFARKHRLHPSALSRILRVGELPGTLLDELASFERLSRTHLEVIATAPAERRPELVGHVRAGRSTYRIRTAARRPPSPSPAPRVETRAPRLRSHGDGAGADRAPDLARALGASPAETRSFALELLGVLLESSPQRVRAEPRAVPRPEADSSA